MVIAQAVEDLKHLERIKVLLLQIAKTKNCKLCCTTKTKIKSKSCKKNS